MKAKLVVVGGEAKAAEINLKLPTIIGRGREAALMLPHPLVSRQHCEIFEQNGQLVVRDMGSLNGTFINNERITEAILPNGELLTIGTVTFRAVYDSAAKTSAKGPPARQPGRGDKTVGQPSDATVDAEPQPTDAARPTVAKPAPKAPAAKTSAPVAKATTPGKSKINSTAAAAGKSSPKSPTPAAKPGIAAGTSSKSNQAPTAAPGKAAPFTAAQDVTLQVPGGPQSSPKKKAWAERKEDVEPIDFSADEEDFELGEDDSVPAAPLTSSEFTIQTAKPAGFGKAREASDEFDVEELDFTSEPAPQKPMVPVKSKEKTTSPISELTTNFDPKKLAEEEKAKSQARAAAKGAEKKKEEPQKPGEKPPDNAGQKKGSLSTDEDLEAFFKSLG